MISIDKRVNGGRTSKGEWRLKGQSEIEEGSDVAAAAHDRAKQVTQKTTSAACLVKVVVHNHGNETGGVP